MHGKIEILAPAGDYDTFIAVINSGADAVYLGLSDFNARMKADNFTSGNIENVVDYAHRYDVKVYVTVNIIIKDDEYKKLYDLIMAAVKAKVDAFIVQDVGVAVFLKEHFPGICLHASTQMGIHNVKGALMAKQLGVKRIVLSRETTLEDIKEIYEKTGLEIEYFVQGALCVAFSGNCYMSSFNNGNSGNRGRCLQLCRLKYDAFENNKYLNSGYLLSPRDLCLIKNIEELENAGVCSFKIEGRLRRKGYGATSVAIYRQALDLYYQEKKLSFEDSILSLKQVFSRGDFNYNAYLTNDIKEPIINKENQNHIGIKIGKSISCTPFKNIYCIELYSVHSLRMGDGLKFIDKNNKEIASIGIGNVDTLKDNHYRIYSKNKVPNGMDMYLTLNSSLEDYYLSLKRKVDISLSCYAYPNSPLVIYASKGNVEVAYTSDYIVQQAVNKPTSKDEIVTQLGKLGDTIYSCSDIKVECENVFLPKSVINDCRRNAISLLEKALKEKEEDKYKVKILPYSNLSTYNFPSMTQNILIVNERTSLDIIEYFLNLNYLIAYSFLDFINAEQFLQNINYDFAINLPNILNKKDLQIIDKLLNKYPNITLVANNISHLVYASKYNLIAGLGLNIISNRALNVYLNIGCKNAILSLETPVKVLNENTNSLYYCVGKNTLMNFAHCPYKVNYHNTCSNCTFNDSLSYKGENKEIHRIRRIKLSKCYFELLNSKCLNTYHKINNLKVIDIRELNDEEILNLYNVIEGQKRNITSIDSIGLLKIEIK